MPNNQTFSQRLLDWYQLYGRKNLPWHSCKDPYRIWLSEIMLQQTQVVTVIGYFDRFVEQLPTVTALAEADLDQVLQLWAGLGYYARARNMHQSARIMQSHYAACVPDDYEALIGLPGIGRSTAGAILAQAFNQRQPILDGNVKRVLTRHYALAGDTSKSALSKHLWSLAEQHTPTDQVGEYTQAIMDLGATLCTRHAPRCQQCPLMFTCQGFAAGDPQRWPDKKVKKNNPIKSTQMLILANQDGEILLRKRPATGIWGGLWSLPEDDTIDGVSDQCMALGYQISLTKAQATLRHSFSHYHLDIIPHYAKIIEASTAIIEDRSASDSWPTLWIAPEKIASVGTPAPIKKIILSFFENNPVL
jgi:A/G-specific adenine glycosylase